MNLAVHGLSGDIKQGNTYYEDIHYPIGKFDFVMANPPFNVNGVDKEKLKGDKRFPLDFPNLTMPLSLDTDFLEPLDEERQVWICNGRLSKRCTGSQNLKSGEMMIEGNVSGCDDRHRPEFFLYRYVAVHLWLLDTGKKKTHRKDKVLLLMPAISITR